MPKIEGFAGEASLVAMVDEGCAVMSWQKRVDPR